MPYFSGRDSVFFGSGFPFFGSGFPFFGSAFRLWETYPQHVPNMLKSKG